MNIYDITPVEPLWDVIDDRTLYEDGKEWFKQDLIDDIRAKGFVYQLNIDAEGYIKNGNGRYAVARYLLEKENDERFRYLPVQRNFATGFFFDEILLQTEIELTPEQENEAMEMILSQKAKYWVEQVREKVIPSRTEFVESIIDPENDVFYMKHWERNKNEWALISHPSPLNSTTTYIIGIMSQSWSDGKRESKDEYLARKAERIRAKEVEAVRLKKSARGRSKTEPRVERKKKPRTRR